ncbi:MAG: hypothetical protein KA116_07975 [Proteobacteria bacterium]|nr:hypothetical protein [Pseudomonadota bacterium]
MRGLHSLILSILGITLLASSTYAENDEASSLTLFAQRACQESLILASQTDSKNSLSVTNEMSIEDIARSLLGGMSQQLDEKPEILAREINALVEGTLIFKTGIVAHIVNIEFSRQFNLGENLTKCREKIEDFSKLSHEKKMEITQNTSERILNLLEELKIEYTEKRSKDLKIPEKDYTKMIDEWTSFRKYDPALYRLQFAILALLQFKPSYFYNHFNQFASGWFKSYRSSHFSVTGHIPRKDLPILKHESRLINLEETPLHYFAESDIWERNFEFYRRQSIADNSKFKIGYIEFIILRFLKSFHLQGLKALATPDKMENYSPSTQDILKKEIDFLSRQLEAQNLANNKVKELENKKSETELTIESIKTQISDLTNEKELKTKLKIEVERSNKSVFMIEVLWTLGNLKSDYFYPHPENAIEIRKIFAKYRRQISSEDFLEFVDLILPRIASKDFAKFEEKGHWDSHNIAKRRWSNWTGAWLLYFRSLSIFVNLEPAQKRYVLDHVRAKFVMSESVSVEWAAEFDKKYLRIGDWGLGEQPNPDKTPSSKSVIEFIQSEIQEVQNKIAQLETELKTINESLSNTEDELRKAIEHNQAVNRHIKEGNAVP